MAKRNLVAGRNQLSGFGLNAFTRAELDAMHYATLQVFQHTGIRVESKSALEIFHSAGAEVDHIDGHGVVKIPPHVVEDCIRWAPSTLVYSARNPRHDFVAEPGRISLTNGGCVVNVMDPYTREHRPSVKKDSQQIALVCDALDEYSIYERACVATDVPIPSMQVHNTEAILSHTGKHFFLDASTPENLRAMIALGAECTGGVEKFKRRPLFTVTVCPNSPLSLLPDTTEVVIEAASQGIGLMIIPMALTGATAPATIAGAIVTTNVEALGALILAQLTAKGTPCTYANTSILMDMRTGVGSLGAPELALINTGASKMAQYYGLPCFVGGGGDTDSKLLDAQAGYESALNALTVALSGANMIMGAGTLNQLLTIDYAKLVMDAEMARMINRIVGGVAVTDETLALDVIHDVGPGGEYLTHAHTYDHMHGLSQSRIFDWNTREIWEAAGAKDVVERSYERVHAILENHRPHPLPDGAAENMRAIVTEYEASLGI